MSRTFQKCDDLEEGKEVRELVNEVLCAHETHKPLLDAKVRIDLLFAYNDEGHALVLHGYPAGAIAKKISLKDRAKGMGDVEISIDFELWNSLSVSERRAILDHELHHFSVRIEQGGIARDDLDRPKIDMRKHDVEVGWFKLIAERNGKYSQERIQAKKIMEECGQFFWPSIAGSAA